MKIEMKLKKDTKRTYVFESVEPDDIITTLYIAKRAFAGVPDRLLVEIAGDGVKED